MDEKDTNETAVTKTAASSRRKFMKGALVAGGAAVAASTPGLLASCQKEDKMESKAPAMGTAKCKTTEWKIQTSWPGGIGLDIFKEWCPSIMEKTGGELAFNPFGA